MSHPETHQYYFTWIIKAKWLGLRVSKTENAITAWKGERFAGAWNKKIGKGYFTAAAFGG